jgi:Zn-dependent protease with chaperone function
MHLLMIILTITVAYLVRYLAPMLTRKLAFFNFLFPPLLLLTTAMAIASMGPDGKMLGLKASWFSYLFAWGYLLVVMAKLGQLTYQAWQQRQSLITYPRISLLNQPVYLIETDFPYCAQIGFWQSQLILSQGLLNLLNPQELTAVIAHEQAHQLYHDNFWFFWLGWLRTSTSWLPHSETLWQELLVWRELRADAWSAQQVGGLVLAEALLTVAQTVNQYVLIQPQLTFSVELSDGNNQRLEERIDALVSDWQSPGQLKWYLSGILASLLPILTIVLHQ